MFSRRVALGLIGGLPLLAPTISRAAAPSPPSLEDLIRPPLARDAAMSPNGKQIAVLFQRGKDSDRLAYLHLIDADAPGAEPKLVVLGDYTVDGLAWASDKRLLVSFFIEREEVFRETGSNIGKKFSSRFRRMMAIGADGSNPVLMFGDLKRFQRVNFDLAMLIDLMPDDDDRILMMAYDGGAPAFSLHHLNVNTGEATFVERGAGKTWGWEAQGGTPVLRYDSNERGTVTTVLSREPGSAEWKPVRQVLVRSEWFRPNFEFVGPTDQAGVFLARTRGEQDSAATIRRYDIRTHELGDIVAARPGRDMEGALFDDRGRFVAGEYTEDRTAYVFADPKFAAHFRGMESFFGKQYNVRLLQTNRDHTRYLARVDGPGVHSAFYFYDSAAAKFEPLGLGKPWLNAEGLARVEGLDVKSRDGTVIRAYLTKPNAAGPRPLIAMPHGGPEARDRIAFDLFAQAFAARGWLVLQPNFRGSAGYGRAFTVAGHGHWGDRMQEDIDDAVAQVLASGAADPAKIAICGMSYGGYAALMGAVRRPDLYKAAVSIAGVSDLPKMLSETRRDADDGEASLVYKLWVERMGDPKTEPAKLVAASPAHRASEIKAPVMLIHGLDDDVVPFRQSAYMAAALKAAGKPHQYIEVTGAGHGDWDDDDEKLILGKTIDFIAKAFA